MTFSSHAATSPRRGEVVYNGSECPLYAQQMSSVPWERGDLEVEIKPNSYLKLMLLNSASGLEGKFILALRV